MSYLGTSVLMIRDSKNNLFDYVTKISLGMKVYPESISKLFLRYSKNNEDIVDISNEDIFVLDYDYENLTKLLKIRRCISSKFVRINIYTPDSITKSNICVFDENSLVKMSDDSLKHACDLNKGDALKGVCKFNSYITGTEHFSNGQFYSYEIMTESGTFYMEGLCGLSFIECI